MAWRLRTKHCHCHGWSSGPGPGTSQCCWRGHDTHLIDLQRERGRKGVYMRGQASNRHRTSLEEARILEDKYRIYMYLEFWESVTFLV